MSEITVGRIEQLTEGKDRVQWVAVLRKIEAIVLENQRLRKENHALRLALEAKHDR